eukprot:927808-Rhodomonas_salina.1
MGAGCTERDLVEVVGLEEALAGEGGGGRAHAGDPRQRTRPPPRPRLPQLLLLPAHIPPPPLSPL